MTDYIRQLQECTSITEAGAILNQIRAGPAIKKLVEIGVILKNHPDKVQQQHGQGMLSAAIQQLQEGNGAVDGKHVDNPHKKSTDADDMHETDKITGALDSHQSSNIEGLEKQGKDAPNTDIESMQTASGEDQMRENMPPGMQPQMPGGPPQQMQGGMCPEVMAQMQPNMPPMPQMNTPQMMKQIQYTVKQETRPLISIIKKQHEALIAMGKQFKEISAKQGTMSYELGSVKKTAGKTQIREVEKAYGVEIPPPIKFNLLKLNDTRSNIRSLNNSISDGSYYTPTE